MFLHLGQETVVMLQDIIGIFDLENTTVSKSSRKFLSEAEKSGEVINVSYELPKSFILCSKPGTHEKRVYISQISSTTLLKRSGFVDNL